MTSDTKGGPTYSTNKLFPVAVVWFADEGQWARMKAVAEDPEKFEDSYAAWTVMFEASLARTERDDVLPIRTPLEADEFVIWCEANGRPRDNSSRSMFAAEIMRGAQPQGTD